jgi:sugar transferase (PEP-CTERM/EpsH1 system associated)
MSKTRILFVNNSLAMGGIETMIVDMVRLLPKAQFAPEVAVFEAGGSLEANLERDGVPVHRLGKRDGIDVSLFMRLRALLRKGRFDVLHTHNYASWLYGNIASRLAGGVVHVHTEHSGVMPSSVRYAIERFLSKRTNHVVAVSDHVVDVLVNRIGVRPQHVKLIHNGVNTGRFSRADVARTATREALGIAGGEVVVGMVARLAPIKNHRYLLDAFEKLSGNAPQTRLLIVGDGPERQALEDHTAVLGITQRVVFTGERRDTEKLLCAMDVYALSSTSEGMNLTLLEAMSSGLPVVATAVGGNTEIVKHDHTGFVVPLNAPDAFAGALEKLVLSEELRRSMGEAGRMSVIERFDERAMIAQYTKLYGHGT